MPIGRTCCGRTKLSEQSHRTIVFVGEASEALLVIAVADEDVTPIDAAGQLTCVTLPTLTIPCRDILD